VREPEISIIMPVYNGEKTLNQSLNSVLDQKYKNFEVIIVDDGSTDKTLEIAKKFKDHRIRIFTQSNQGAWAARNTGIKKSKGKYISFIDCDDLWTKDKLELQLEKIEKNPKSEVAYSWIDYIDEDNKFIKEGGRSEFNGNVLKDILLMDFIASGSNILVKKRALDKVGYFRNLPVFQDLDMWIRLAMEYEFVPVKHRQIFYRISIGSISHENIFKREKVFLNLMQEVFGILPIELRYLKKDCIINRYKCLVYDVFQYPIKRKHVWIVTRLLWIIFKNDPRILRDSILLTKIIFRIIIIISVPQRLSDQILIKFNESLNIEGIYKYIKDHNLVKRYSKAN